MRSSPYPYNVNILFNIFTLSQEKSTESFRFCNNCAVLLVRSSHQQEKSIVLPFLWMFICWKISSIFLSSYLKRGAKRDKSVEALPQKKIAPFLHIVDICPLPLCIPTPSSQTTVAFETPCLSSAINNIDSGVGGFWR